MNTDSKSLSRAMTQLENVERLAGSILNMMDAELPITSDDLRATADLIKGNVQVATRILDDLAYHSDLSIHAQKNGIPAAVSPPAAGRSRMAVQETTGNVVTIGRTKTPTNPGGQIA